MGLGCVETADEYCPDLRTAQRAQTTRSLSPDIRPNLTRWRDLNRAGISRGGFV